MEVKFNIRQVVMWRIVLFSGIISLICACSYSGKKVCPPFDISFSGHTLLAIAPGFTIKATEDTLNKTYPCLRSGKMFPLTGILKVDGKSYRFLGGDSLRISSLAPLSNENLGWQGKYSYLFPGRGWEQREYNDSLWNIRVKVPSVRKMGSFKPIQYGERKIYMFAGTLPLLTKIL